MERDKGSRYEPYFMECINKGGGTQGLSDNIGEPVAKEATSDLRTGGSAPDRISSLARAWVSAPYSFITGIKKGQVPSCTDAPVHPEGL